MSSAASMKAIADVMDRQRNEDEQNLLSALHLQWKQFGEIRDKDLLVQIGYLSDVFFEEILASHPAKELSDGAKNVLRAFYILEVSRSELIDLTGRFHYRVMHRPLTEIDIDAALGDATKTVYTYANAAESLVQAYRHMVPTGSKFSQEYEALKKELIEGVNVIKFFKDLRNSNNHIRILDAAPHYKITQSFSTGTTEVSSGLRFNARSILTGDKWSPQSKAMASTNEDLQVLNLVNEHFEIASAFHHDVFVRTGIHSDASFRDYARLKIARKSISYRVTLGIILQIAVPKKLNPYKYLHTWFTEDELARIYALPDHSKEQLEYMISMRDPLELCDTHTREQLCRLFSVP
jgi:hypothetical protein